MKKEDWKIGDIAIALLLLLLSTAFSVLVLASTDYEFNELFYLCIEIIVMLPSVAYLYTKYPYNIFPVQNVHELIKYSFVGLVISCIIHASLLQGPDKIPLEYDFVVMSDFPSKLIYLGLMCVLGPITEEVLFRGLIYRILKHRFDIVTATIVGTGIFTVVHIYGGGDLFVVALSGLLFVYVYEKSGTLLASMITHSLYNSIWFGFVYLGLN